MDVFLPPLRKRIRRGVLMIVGFYGAFGFILLLIVIFIAAGFTPKAIHRNYDSIDAAMKMSEAWNALRHPTEHPTKGLGEWELQFRKSLAFSKSNVTEFGEEALVNNLESLWNQRTKANGELSAAEFTALGDGLDRLIRLNEAALFKYAAEADDLKRMTLKVTLLFSLVALITTIISTDNFSTELAYPLKRIAEVLRNKPRPGTKLKLPVPNSLEVRILIQEIRNLWERVSETDRLNVENVMQQSGKLQAVLAAVEDAVLVLDPEGRITHYNEKLKSIVGVQGESLAGLSWKDLPSVSENYLKLRNLFAQTLDEENVFDLEVGAAVEVYAGRSRIVKNEFDEAVGQIFLLHNITEKRQRERLKAEFIGVLSHELKTPLQSLGTAAELLSAGKASFSDNQNLFIDTINEDVIRIRAVVNDFIQVIQAGQQSIRLNGESSDLTRLLPVWLKPFKVTAADGNVELDLEIERGTDVAVIIDPVKFQWVISNLLSNSVRVSPANGRVTVRLERADNQIVLSVTDAGPGISDQILGRIFEPYFKGSDATEGLSGFLGLGLTIAKEVIEAHGGEIAYERRLPTGSIFRVSVPILAT